MGRVGSCFDNAVAESWFATLKTEIGTTIWDTREQARADVFAFIQRYNRNRRHSTLDYSPPRKPNCVTVTSYRSRRENQVSVKPGELHRFTWTDHPRLVQPLGLGPRDECDHRRGSPPHWHHTDHGCPPRTEHLAPGQ